MRTYAEYLNTMTVKTLNVIAKQMGLKGYSKLRKAELIEFIDSEIAEGAHKLALMIEVNKADTFARNEIIDTAPVTETIESAILSELSVIFSQAPVKAPESNAEAVVIEDEPTNTLQDLKDAYRNMRRTVRDMRNGPSRIRIVGQLRKISAELKIAGINPAYL